VETNRAIAPEITGMSSRFRHWRRGIKPGMTGRKLLIALTAAVLYAGLLSTSASAEEHNVRVTLVNGQVLVMKVDVPPGGTVAASLPALGAPVASVEDLGPVETPTPIPTPPLPAVPAVPGTTSPSPTPGETGGNQPPANGGSDNGGNGSGSGPKDGAPATTPNAGANVESLSGDVTRKADGTRRKAGGKRNSVTAPDGTPTLDNPTISLAEPGPALIGVPNFFIDKFRIPPFLLPIYQAAGIQYGVRWEVLAAINEIETDYGRNLNVSTAGAVGWMQFMPSTWRAYGVDANGDEIQDPYNPADAIFAAARYLRAAGADTDLRKAIFAYNHADWYVDSVILRARLIGGLPSNLVGSLTGLTQGRFPVQAKARYAKSLSKAKLRARKRTSAAVLVESTDRRGIEIYARSGAPVIAVNDGRIVRVGTSKRLGNFVQLQDVYGNTYTYAHLKRVVQRYPSPKPQTVTQEEIAKELELPKRDAAPTTAASDTTHPAAKAPRPAVIRKATPASRTKAASRTTAKQRLFANPHRPKAADAGGAQQVFEKTGRVEGQSMGGYFRRVFGLDRKDIQLRTLRKGSRVTAGTILGRLGRTVPGKASHLLFEIRPAGSGAPRIDPKPILDGWKLLESTAIYRAAGRNPFFGRDAATPSIGQILLMGKDALAQRVVADPRIQVYDCGRRDVLTGQIDRRVLATLAFLAASGLRPTVTSLRCGHSYLTASGNVSEHSSGNAVDIAAVNGITISPGTQGAGSITETTIQRLLTLQGTLKPHQIISLMKFEGTDNTFAMSDHDDHIHVGFQPLYGTNSKLAKQVNAILRPKQWIKLIDRLGAIDNPTVRRTPSRFATKVKSGSAAHRGD
jgi:murein DD-endopeptidase MepM/ murein hydrolase activator NlpD